MSEETIQEASPDGGRGIEGHIAYLGSAFVMVPTAILVGRKRDKLTYRDVCIYLHLIAMQGENECLWWSVQGMARATGLCETEVKKSLRHLEKSGHIKRTRPNGNGTCRTYCMTKVSKAGKVSVKDKSPVSEPAIGVPARQQAEKPPYRAKFTEWFDGEFKEGSYGPS